LQAGVSTGRISIRALRALLDQHGGGCVRCSISRDGARCARCPIGTKGALLALPDQHGGVLRSLLDH
jgi:hypothetical protein